MKYLPVLIGCVAVLFVGGCSKGKPKEVPESVKHEAAVLVSEAQFAMQIREYARAEELVRRALKLREDMPEYWVSLGMALRKKDDKAGARKAYEKALDLHADRYEAEKTPEGLSQQAFVLALLGRTDEALKLLQKGLKEYPDSTTMKEMANPRGLPRTFRTDEFRGLML